MIQTDNATGMNLATSWVTAGYTGKSEAIEMVKNNMAEDGISGWYRYVGFGFIWNPEGDGMVVDYVVPDSPADSVLKEGDAFVEVNGVRLTNDNRNQLGFRGMPGEKVNAVILFQRTLKCLYHLHVQFKLDMPYKHWLNTNQVLIILNQVMQRHGVQTNLMS